MIPVKYAFTLICHIYIVYIMILLDKQYINPVICPHNGDLFIHLGVRFLDMTYVYPRSNE